MATLALAETFLTEFGHLERRTQSKVRQIIETFRRSTAAELRAHNGIHLESYTGARDPRARTIRIDDNRRGIVCDTGNDEHFILCQIRLHDDADRWMMNNEFRVNEVTGALEIVDVSEIEAFATGVSDAEPATAALFDHRRDRDFVSLGVDASLVPVARALTSDEQLLAFADVLPKTVSDALLRLAEHDEVDAIYADIAGAHPAGSIDTNDVVAALDTPASRAQFLVISDDDQLQEMLAKPLAHWRTFLHPSQDAVAYRPTFNGPARVTGGAGTGKTVVAIHRAVHLAGSSDESVIGRPVLFTAYTKNLAASIERDVRDLGGADIAARIEVTNVDAFAHRVVRDAEDTQPRIITETALRSLAEMVVDEQLLDISADFLINEWEQVVLAQACRNRSDYFNANRAGRGVRLDRRRRAEIWRAIEELTRQLTARGERTWLQLSADAAGYLSGRSVKPYEHVVVDEAQDLHETQWRLLRAAVDEHANDMFIVGDSHQRIYERRSSLNKVGINIRGRSKKLRINYRTTFEILRFGLGVLGEIEFDDLDEGVDGHRLGEYFSFTHGEDPVLFGADSRRDEYKALVDQVKIWAEGGVDTDEIGIATRTGEQVHAIAAALTQDGVPTVELGVGVPVTEGVRIGTMHRMKGLEFRCIAVADCTDGVMPLRSSLTSKSDDVVQHRLDLERERCLLYVACTRARDHLWVGWSGTPSPFLERAQLP